MKEFDIYLNKNLTGFDICLNNRLTECDAIISSIPNVADTAIIHKIVCGNSLKETVYMNLSPLSTDLDFSSDIYKIVAEGRLDIVDDIIADGSVDAIAICRSAMKSILETHADIVDAIVYAHTKECVDATDVYATMGCVGEAAFLVDAPSTCITDISAVSIQAVPQADAPAIIGAEVEIVGVTIRLLLEMDDNNLSTYDDMSLENIDFTFV